MEQLPEKTTLSDEEQLEDLKEMLAAREAALLEAREQRGDQKARQEIARKMKEDNESIERIASLTGLSLEEIQNLQ